MTADHGQKSFEYSLSIAPYCWHVWDGRDSAGCMHYVYLAHLAIVIAISVHFLPPSCHFQNAMMVKRLIQDQNIVTLTLTLNIMRFQNMTQLISLLICPAFSLLWASYFILLLQWGLLHFLPLFSWLTNN